jgi:hypothetical protein
MSDPFDAIDAGQDFSDFAVGQEPVAVRSIHPLTGATLVTAEDVPAVGLVRISSAPGARTGEVGHTKNTIWVRCDQLGFTLKPKDQIESADGTVWLLDDVEFSGVRGTYYVAKCDVTLSRSH